MEHVPAQPENIEEIKKKIIEEILTHAKELIKSGERLTFPGINPEAYRRIKAEEEDFLDDVTPIDDLIARFRAEGMRIVLAKDPSLGHIYVVPWGATDFNGDKVLLRNLQISGTNARLRILIEETKKFRELADSTK